MIRFFTCILIVIAMLAAACNGDADGDLDADAGDAAQDEVAAEDVQAEEDEPAPDGSDALDVADDDVSQDAAEDVEWVLPELAWTTCSLFEGESDGRAQCAEMEVPRRWDADDGRRFTVFAKRIPAATADPEGQVWLLEGGPGGSGSHGWPPTMDYLHRAFPSFDAYTLDARGTGHSQFLPCPADETMEREVDFASSMAQINHCISYLVEEHGDDLHIFGATPSSHDLHAFIEATRSDGDSVFLWGNSAGTHWAFRFLQLYPDAADGVVLEALLTPDFFGGFQDEGFETSIQSVLTMCADDVFCSSKLPDPRAALAGLIEEMEGGHCSEHEWTAEGLRGMIGLLAYYRPYNEAIPAIIYRLARCGEADMAVLDEILERMGFLASPQGFSIAVFFNEYFSEMWDHPEYVESSAYIEYLDAFYEDAQVVSGEGYMMNDIFQVWPVYDDPLDGAWPETDAPMLLLQGQLDPATSYAMAQGAADHFTGPYQHFLAFPYTPHGVIFGTPTGHSPLAADCGVELLRNFIEDPEGELDTSCMDRIVSCDFEGTHHAPRIMGTDDYWEN